MLSFSNSASQNEKLAKTFSSFFGPENLFILSLKLFEDGRLWQGLFLDLWYWRKKSPRPSKDLG